MIRYLRPVVKWVSFSTFIAAFLCIMRLSVNLNEWSIGANPTAVQSLNVIPVVPFAILYVLFVSSGLVAGYFFRSPGLRAVFLGIFTVVAIGFWVIHVPWVYEGPNKLINNAVIQDFGHIDATKSYGTYLGFPGLFIIGYSFSVLTGLDGLSFLPFLISAFAVLMALMFYIIAIRVLGDNFQSYLASFVVLAGNVLLNEYEYHPDFTFIYVVLGSALLLALMRGRSRNIPIILFGITAVVGDFSVAVVILLFLVLALWTAKKDSNSRIPRVLIVYTVILGIWLTFWSVLTTTSLVGGFTSYIHNLGAGFQHVNQLYTSNSSGPLWAGLVKLTWIGLLIVVPLALIAVGIFYKRMRPSFVSSLLLLSPVFAGLLATVGQGGANYFVVLLYAPFGGALILFHFSRRRRYLTLLFTVILLFSLAPSFFAFNNRVVTFSYPQQYFTSAEWFTNHSSGNAQIFTINYAVQYYDPLQNVVYPTDLYGASPNINSSGAMQLAELYISSFAHSESATYLLDATDFDNYYHLFGYDVGYSIQKHTYLVLDQTNLIYSDGYASVYHRAS